MQFKTFWQLKALKSDYKVRCGAEVGNLSFPALPRPALLQLQLGVACGAHWRVWHVACGTLYDAVRQTTSDRLAYNYNNVDGR